MAKFKINTTLITALTNAGFIDGSGNTAMTFASRTSGITTLYKVTFSAAADVIETTNDRMIKACTEMAPPAVQEDGVWIIGNPTTVKMFETTTDVGTVDPAVDGVAQITTKEKGLIIKYVHASGDGPEPAGRDQSTSGPWVVKARNYFDNLRS